MSNNNYKVAIEFSRKREHEHSTLRMFARLTAHVAYKKAIQDGQKAVMTQSVLCEDALCVERTVKV